MAKIVKAMHRSQQTGGLRIHGSRVDSEIRGAFVRYARWLRRHYAFPVFVPAYLSPKRRLLTIENEIATASIFLPYNRRENPRIRVATGDYPEMLEESGRDSALASLLCSLSHELVHYWQWLETGETTERGVVVRARNMVFSHYASYVDHP